MNAPRPAVIGLLDDDTDLLDTVAQMLALLGFEPHTFRTQDALLAAVDHFPFEGFVLDWRLASGTAARVVHALRRSGTVPAPPIIVLSGNLPLGSTPVDEELASVLALPQVRYRAKPCRTRELAEDLWAGIHALRAATA
ncbi:MAG: hypothetical protein ACOYLV_03745 [Rubrivivax sp.]|jgi:DNA-binding response OmpR family regulator